jgi:hypothetical protein
MGLQPQKTSHILTKPSKASDLLNSNATPAKSGSPPTNDHHIPGSSLSTFENRLPAGTPQPDSWFFDIYIDTQDDEVTNLLEHSTRVLDISSSNDMSNTGGYIGQENIYPEDPALGKEASDSKDTGDFIAISFSRGSVRGDRPRAPLGDLNPSDLYPFHRGEEAPSIPDHDYAIPEKDVFLTV